jgi:hypothetical protein
MSKPPPDDLKSWSKNALVREVQRLRALTREHAERMGDDPREAATTDAAITDVTGDPHARGGVLLDARSAVLLESTDVALMDTKSEREPVAMMMALAGRINYSLDRVEHAYLFGPDGAAALVSQLIGLAHRASLHEGDGMRFAAEFKVALEARMNELP